MIMAFPHSYWIGFQEYLLFGDRTWADYNGDGSDEDDDRSRLVVYAGLNLVK